MPNHKASRTALGTAYLRAAHQLFETPPRILDDPVFAAKLRGMGFSKLEFLSPAEADERYFRQYPGELPVPKQTNILCAVLYG